MKLSITEVRDLVAEVIKKTIREAKKAKKAKKVVPDRSEEAVLAQKDRAVRATGYSHGDDFSAPLGDASVPKKQGASNIGNFTTGDKVAESQLRHLIKMIVAEEIRSIKTKAPK